jgi:hypothetical protein
MKNQEKQELVIIDVATELMEYSRSHIGEVFENFPGKKDFMIFCYKKKKRIEVSLFIESVSLDEKLTKLFPGIKINANGDDFIDFVVKGKKRDEFLNILSSEFKVEVKSFS